ncbi:MULTISPECIES: chemotaxis protein [unclassified Acinetobacter]|uniref:chemotaxis protein n=1 Tax=Acinetobacter TaxID=469 RepID=UPI00157AFB30|nr:MULTISPECIES: chemotaxis protein [unclassified Acinetobacter]MDM1756052.1 chemotaxis protein [Acinetobacter sp. 256-1]MDM1760506.1 chemotaxis protein [Acinetobacter sp. 251-1]
MSYQTSIYFDPTALLIIKNEVDNSIQLVESAVSSLVEDQTLPFGIDDALNQFEQCAHVIRLIDMPQLAQLTEYAAELMRKIMQDPQNIKTSDVLALSEGTTMLKRFIEFTCLREVKVHQFLLDTLNRLELALGKPLTQDGESIAPLLDCVVPNLELQAAPELEKSAYVHKLYKICLNNLLKQQESPLDFQGLQLVGSYLSYLSEATATAQYWKLVANALQNIKDLILSDARLRTLIQIETHIAAFLQDPQQFNVNTLEIANVISLCISQDNDLSQYLREKINAGDDILTDNQLQVFSRHLYGPDFETIHTASKLITDEMSEIRNDIEYNYENMSDEKTAELKNKLLALVNIFKVLNLNEAANELTQQAALLSDHTSLSNENYAQQLMNSILSAMNSIGILERNYTSNRLQLRVNNLHISLDRLDDAHTVLLAESKVQIDATSQTLVQYISEQNNEHIANIPMQLKEISGAMLFLGSQESQKTLLDSADFVEAQLSQQAILNPQQVQALLEILASADMMIDNLQNKQPVLQSMFDIALNSSQNLKATA